MQNRIEMKTETIKFKVISELMIFPIESYSDFVRTNEWEKNTFLFFRRIIPMIRPDTEFDWWVRIRRIFSDNGLLSFSQMSNWLNQEFSAIVLFSVHRPHENGMSGVLILFRLCRIIRVLRFPYQRNIIWESDKEFNRKSSLMISFLS